MAEGLVLVDGSAGTVTVDPTDEQVAAALALAAQVRTFDGHGHTADGHRVELLANVGDPSDAAPAAAAGAEGVGLFRTEFGFLDRDEAPSIDEQVTAYRRVLAAFPGRKVVVRTLDAGADKPLPFLAGDPEVNPALGVRGLRTAARHPEVLEDQLAAIARAAAAETAEVWVMAPMVSTVDEAEQFVAACAAHGLAGRRRDDRGAERRAAGRADPGARRVREHRHQRPHAVRDGRRPAARRRRRAVRPVAARGAAPRRRGLRGRRAAGPPGRASAARPRPTRRSPSCSSGSGSSSLSMTPRALPDVAALLAVTPLDECRRLAQLALAASSAADARAVVRAGLPVLEELGL